LPSRGSIVDAALLEELTSIVSRAAAAILTARAGALELRHKADQSPVTAADHASEAAILSGLAQVLPGVPVVSEEAASASAPARPADPFLLVDPLDGTRELVAGRNEFTVNLAMVSGGRPQLGIVAAPAQGVVWRGVEGSGAERLSLSPGAPSGCAGDRHPIAARSWPGGNLVAAVSRSHLDPRTEALLARLPVRERIACGSALKFCQLAEGRADIYPRLATTCEWDVAAGHALLAAAGGRVLAPDGSPLRYGQHAEQFRIQAFVAWGDPSSPARLKAQLPPKPDPSSR
jgi:3'(2'), 5'-bisphosphate nucleotidase